MPTLRFNSNTRTIEFAPGDMHRKYVPGSIYNTTKEGRLIKEAVTSTAKPTPVTDASGLQVQRELKDKSGRVTKKVPVFSKKRGNQSRIRSYLRAKYVTSDIAKGQHWKEQDDLRNKLVSSRTDHHLINAELKSLKSRQKASFVHDARTALRAEGGAGVNPDKPALVEIQRHRDYQAKELKQVRSIIQAERKQRGTLPAPMKEEDLGRFINTGKDRELVPGRIQKEGRARTAPSGLKALPQHSSAAKRDLTNVANIEHYTQKLNTTAVADRALAQKKAGLWERGIQRRIERGVNRIGITARSDPRRTAHNLLEPLRSPVSGGLKPVQADTIANALTHGYAGSENIVKLNPQKVSSETVNKIKERLDSYRSESNGGSVEGMQRSQKRVLTNSGFFEGPKPRAVAVAQETKGMPHLKKLGAGLLVAGGLGLGIAALRRHLKGPEEPEQTSLSSRIRPIFFAGKFNPIPMPANKVGRIRDVLKSNRMKGAADEFDRLANEGRIKDPGIKDAPHILQVQNDGLHERVKKLSEENNRLASEAAKNAKADTFIDVATAHNKGVAAGAEEAKKGFLKEQQLARESHEKQITETRGQRDSANKKAKFRLKAAIIGTGAAGTGGLLIGSNMNRNETQFAEKKGEWDPAVHAGISAGISGGVLGGIPAFQHGTKFKAGLKGIGVGALLGAAAVGGGTYVGERILGKPRQKESAPITKRAALGGAAVGAAVGVGAGILAHKTKIGRNKLAELGKTWRPATWAAKSGVLGAAGIGGGAGAIVIGGHSADEGQQVDTLAALKKPTQLSSRIKVIQFAKQPPVAYDRYGKQIKEKEDAFRNSNYTKSAVAGAAIGALLKGNMKIGRAALIGAGAGTVTQAAARAATSDSRDRFGEKRTMAKQVEKAPWMVGAGLAAGIGGIKAYRKSPMLQNTLHKFFRSKLRVIRFDADEDLRADQKWAHRAIYGRERKTFPLAQEIYRNAGRAGRLISSTTSHITGNPNLDERGREKRSEWSKPWVKTLAATAAIGGGILVARQAKNALKRAPVESRLGQAREAMLTGDAGTAARQKLPIIGKISKFFSGVGDDIAKVFSKPIAKGTEEAKKAAGREKGFTYNPVQSPKKAKMDEADAAARFKNISTGKVIHPQLSANGRVIRFAYYNPDWRIADADGNHARIFAPGHTQRQRRAKEWHERADNQRLIGTAAATLLGGAGLLVGRKLRGKSLARNAETAIEHTPANVVPFVVQASSRIRPIRFEEPYRKNEKLSTAADVASIGAKAAILGGAGILAWKGGRIISKHRKAATEAAQSVITHGKQTLDQVKSTGDKIKGSVSGIDNNINRIGNDLDGIGEGAGRLINVAGHIKTAAKGFKDRAGKFFKGLIGNPTAPQVIHVPVPVPTPAPAPIPRPTINPDPQRKIELNSAESANARNINNAARLAGSVAIGGGAIYLTLRGARGLNKINKGAGKFIADMRTRGEQSLTSVNEAAKGIESTVGNLDRGMGDLSRNTLKLRNKIPGSGFRPSDEALRANSAARGIAASSKVKAIWFDEKQKDYAAPAAAAAGLTGALAASQYHGGRDYIPGEDLKGKRVIRAHKRIPFLQHEGIGIGGGMIAETTDDGKKRGPVKIGAIDQDKFGWGEKIKVVDDVRPGASKRARAAVGKSWAYNLFTNSCQDFTESVFDGKKRFMGRQLRQAVGGGLAAAAAGYGAAKLISSLKPKEQKMSSRAPVIRFAKKEDEPKTNWKRGAMIGGAALAAGATGAVLGAKARMRQVPKGRLLQEGENLMGKVIYRESGKVTPLGLYASKIRQGLSKSAANGNPLSKAAIWVDDAIGIHHRHYGVGIEANKLSDLNPGRGGRDNTVAGFSRKGKEKIYVDSEASVSNQAQRDALKDRHDVAKKNAGKGEKFGLLGENCEVYGREIAGQGRRTFQGQAIKRGSTVGGLAGVVAGGGAVEIATHKDDKDKRLKALSAKLTNIINY